MNYSELMKNRRAVREFQSRDVPLEIVKAVIQDTTLAPTASNGQPCRFIIIQDRGLMKQISDESKRNLIEDAERNPGSPLGQYVEVLKNEAFNVFYNAPCLVLLTGPKAIASLAVDCALTAAYFMFSATEHGLGTCWVALGSNIKDPAMFKKIGLPDDCAIVAPLVLGYPAAIPAASERHAPEILKIIC
jgi:nitroreductase